MLCRMNTVDSRLSKSEFFFLKKKQLAKRATIKTMKMMGLIVISIYSLKHIFTAQ